MRGKFVTLEGGEGSGKSTQIKLLEQKFSKHGIPCVVTREPGGTETGEKIRDLLVNGSKSKLLPITELLLNFAARYEHVEKVIKPALAKGHFVISDRFYDSSFVYQGVAQGLNIEIVERIKCLILGGFVPDMTFILDIDVETGMKRANIRNSNENRYEKMGNGFHQKVRKGFLDIAKNNPERCVVINAAKKLEEVHKNIIKNIDNKLGLKI